MIRKSPEEATILLWIAFILIDQIYDIVQLRKCGNGVIKNALQKSAC
jgi:hypothetical protein